MLSQTGMALKLSCDVRSFFFIHVPQPLIIFILKNLDSMSNEMLFRVLGSKFGVGYLRFLKKDRKKLLKDH